MLTHGPIQTHFDGWKGWLLIGGEDLRKASARVREGSARQEGKKRGGVGGGRQERKKGGVG